MSDTMIVTIDGPAGVGKSTMARLLAAELGIAYLDTGAMFRAVAWRLGDGVQHWEPGRLEEELGWIEFSLEGSGAETRLRLNRNLVGDEIRTEEVGMWASNVATMLPVRGFLKSAQQNLGQRFSLVAEGRDMGTVVFPDAPHKFFLDADVKVRAKRRYDQLNGMGKPADLKALEASIAKRDEQDRNRAVAPLKPADDAVLVDSSAMTKEQVFARILEVVKG
ncbi:(d)CMP kinase [Pseudodesulfovibrio senegalensis]|uniref:Cytidylate kinase n=1 Tax=Pseudodesulfovibrio senegalensis TaxID=1721087 RepID=A0A6N6N2T6_9BACT|nr:(d)CMP kinase [Pseudodesulfovibrio senegalensis]KAB1441887.1 (d)CMP kinase [Pseudodesulfovibrio senegalensis]